ncbi:hypothetical protein ACFXJ8_43370 [Nonomuraea sp. NPDC059194]|uniref:hypothetical protein n=1 Tax=Nonomuraea sp. NPDC059194 TaxID=3346764 RepID=UPI0036C08D37
MHSKEFTKAFEYELQNRAFALRAMFGIARRLHGDPQNDFWGGYARLERFNVPRYAEAAQRWGLDPQPQTWTRIRGTVIGATPKFMLRSLLKFAYPKTVEYLEELRRMRGLGPDDGKAFLDYVVDQEVVQIEMMQLALNERYPEITRNLEAFFQKYSDKDLFD